MFNQYSTMVRYKERAEQRDDVMMYRNAHSILLQCLPAEATDQCPRQFANQLSKERTGRRIS
jgi:hypothetical protein